MRFLTEDEIEDILDFIKPNKSIPIATAKSIVHITKEKFRNQLKKQKLYQDIIPELKKQLQNKYRESLIQPGESVGIIAAQSIGEKNTQSTLNSVDWKDVILYTKDSKHIIEPIGQMIDNLLLKYPEMVDKIEENRTEYLSLENGYYIPSCDENGITSWCKIEAITRHLPVGKLVKVTTESGRVVTATQSKSFLVWNGEKFIDKEGANIKIGDILPTTQKLNRFSDKLQDYITYDSIKVHLDREIGFLIGLYINIDNEKNLVKYEERINKLKLKYSFNLNNFLDNITLSGTSIPLFSYNCSDEYIKGLLTGFFKSCIYNTKDGSIECISYYENIISGILFLLTYFGVFGYFINLEEDELVYKLKIKSDNTEILEKYILEEIWKDIPSKMLNISKNCIIACATNKQKTSAEFIWKYDDSIKEISKEYEEIKDIFNIYFDKIIKIEYIDGTTPYVYDLTVEKTRNFQLFNGLNMRDTFHKAKSGLVISKILLVYNL